MTDRQTKFLQLLIDEYTRSGHEITEHQGEQFARITYRDGSVVAMTDISLTRLSIAIEEKFPAAIDEDFIADFARWNFATFGPGFRTSGTIDHIRKELAEIEADPTDAKEWVDVLLLALNALVRLGKSPLQIISLILGKHRINQSRRWPDWRNHPDTAIEHDRSADLKQAGIAR